jgi:hypothetical protein
MIAKELYDYITSQMTAEEALKKLLESSLINYKKLKFNKGEEIHPLILIASASMDMGWQIAVEKDQDEVRGVSVGTVEYMEQLFKE